MDKHELHKSLPRFSACRQGTWCADGEKRAVATRLCIAARKREIPLKSCLFDNGNNLSAPPPAPRLAARTLWLRGPPPSSTLRRSVYFEWSLEPASLTVFSSPLILHRNSPLITRPPRPVAVGAKCFADCSRHLQQKSRCVRAAVLMREELTVLADAGELGQRHGGAGDEARGLGRRALWARAADQIGRLRDCDM